MLVSHADAPLRHTAGGASISVAAVRSPQTSGHTWTSVGGRSLIFGFTTRKARVRDSIGDRADHQARRRRCYGEARSREALGQPVGHDGQRLGAVTLQVVRRALHLDVGRVRRAGALDDLLRLRPGSRCRPSGAGASSAPVTFGIVSASLAWLDSPDQVESHPRPSWCGPDRHGRSWRRAGRGRRRASRAGVRRDRSRDRGRPGRRACGRSSGTS